MVKFTVFNVYSKAAFGQFFELVDSKHINQHLIKEWLYINVQVDAEIRYYTNIK